MCERVNIQPCMFIIVMTIKSIWPSGQGIGLEIIRSGIRFPLLVMRRDLGQTSYFEIV